MFPWNLARACSKVNCWKSSENTIFFFNFILFLNFTCPWNLCNAVLLIWSFCFDLEKSVDKMNWEAVYVVIVMKCPLWIPYLKSFKWKSGWVKSFLKMLFKKSFPKDSRTGILNLWVANWYLLLDQQWNSIRSKEHNKSYAFESSSLSGLISLLSKGLSRVLYNKTVQKH